MNGQKKLIVFAIVVIINFVLKTLFLDYSPFSYDESISVKDTLLDFGHIKHESEWDNNPPFYYYCLWVWLKVFTVNEYNARLLSVLFVSFAIGLFDLFIAKNLNRKIAFFVTVMLTFSNFLMFYSQEARTYSLVLFLGVVSTILFFKYLEKEKAGVLIALSLVNFLIIYSHYIAGMIVFIQYILLISFLRKNAIKALLVQTTVILFLVLLRFTKKQFLLIFGYGESNDFWLQESTFNDFIETVVALFYSPVISLAFFASCFLAVYFIIKKSKALNNRIILYSFVLGFVSIFVLFFIGLFKPVFLGRYLVFAIPFATLFFVHICLNLEKFGIVLASFMAISTIYSFKLKKEVIMDYKSTAELISSLRSKGDIIIINTKDNLNLFWYYYNKKTFLENKNLEPLSQEAGVYGVNDLESLEGIRFQEYSKVFLIQSFHKLNGRVDNIGEYLSKKFKKKYKTDFYRGVEISIFRN